MDVFVFNEFNLGFNIEDAEGMTIEFNGVNKIWTIKFRVPSSKLILQEKINLDRL